MGVGVESVRIEIAEGYNLILGQAHFIKTIEDLAEAIVSAGSSIKFGIAFCEASGPCLIRTEGNDDECLKRAVSCALELGAGHSFCIMLGRGAYPINVLDRIKNCQEVCGVFCATANPIEVIVARTAQGAAILGVVDGYSPKGIESEKDKADRKAMLRRFGYKL